MYGLSFYDLTTFSHALLIDGHYLIMSVVFLKKVWSLSNVQLASFQPHNTRWMNAVECRLAQARLSEDVGEADKDNAEDS